MAKNNHSGLRKRRVVGQCKPRLGYYLIITDAEETEVNFFNGLRDSLPKELKRNVVIKTISNVKTEELVSRALEEQAKSAQYGNTWIVFDGDEVADFDGIIQDAGAEKLNVGWSNPCFEIWLESYFGTMGVYQNSEQCCKEFAKTFKKHTNKEYCKNSKSLYKDLRRCGDEDKAISLAGSKMKAAKEKTSLPSEMNPATSVYELVDEIKSKTKR